MPDFSPDLVFPLLLDTVNGMPLFKCQISSHAEEDRASKRDLRLSSVPAGTCTAVKLSHCMNAKVKLLRIDAAGNSSPTRGRGSTCIDSSSSIPQITPDSPFKIQLFTAHRRSPQYLTNNRRKVSAPEGRGG